MITLRGLVLEKSFDNWVDDGNTVHSLTYGDRIAVIRKPHGT
jgi:hypothetical protein